MLAACQVSATRCLFAHHDSQRWRSSGQGADIEIHAKEILYLRERLNKILSERTGQPVEKIAKDTDRDNFMSGEDAVKYGLIDKIFTNRNEQP